MSIVESAKLLQESRVVCFSFPLTYEITKGEYKKNLQRMPKNWTKFTLDVPLEQRVKDCHNGLGILTGMISLIFGVDVDNNAQFESYLKDLKKVMPPTWTVQTGSGGRHYYFKWHSRMEQIKTTSKVIVHKGQKLDVDVRSTGGFLICPPSKAQAGSEVKSYQWSGGLDPGSVELAEMPDWLFDALTQTNSATKSVPDKSHTQSSACSRPPIGSVPQLLIDFIVDTFSVLPDKLRDLKYDASTETFSIGLKEKACLFAKQEHTSNHQFLLIKKNGTIVRKCHSNDDKCDGKEHKPTKVPDAMMKELNQKYKSEAIDQELITLACMEGAYQVKELFPGNDDMALLKARDDKTLSGPMIRVLGHTNCWQCNEKTFTAIVYPDGIEVVCDVCGKIHPGGPLKMPMDLVRYSKLGTYLQVNFNVFNNITNIYNHSDAPDFEWNAFLEDNVLLVENEAINYALTKALGGGQESVAELLYSLFGARTVFCADQWYQFEQHYWVQCKEVMIHKLFRDRSFKSLFLEAKNRYAMAPNVTNKEKKLAQIQKLIQTLESDGFQNGVIRQLAVSCHKPETEFKDRLDKQKHIIGFTNGIFDLSTNTFRNGRQDDFVTITVGFDYDFQLMNDENVIRDINVFFSSVFPDQEVCRYVIKFLASCLGGYTNDQLFHFGHGDGSNGKGVLLALMFQTLGQYAGKLDSSFLTGKTPDANAPTPALTNLLGKRFVGLSETVDGSRINEQLFKSLCGQDRLVFRPLNQEAREFDPTFKLLLVCNELPEFKGFDYSMKRRIRVIPFVSQFVSNPDESKGEKLLDKQLMDKIKDWKHAFMGILLQGYQLYCEKGLNAPPAIIRATAAYEQDNNRFALFLEQNYKKKVGEECSVSEVGKHYMDWCGTLYGKESVKYKQENKYTPKLTDILAKDPWCIEKTKGNKGGFYQDLTRK